MSNSNTGSVNPRHCEDARSRLYFVTLIYVVFIISAGSWVFTSMKYRDSRHWPSVETKILDQGGKFQSFPSQGRFGPSSTQLDSSWVKIEYTVKGKTYVGDQGTPDSKGLPGRMNNATPWRAFYNPDAPEIAVLSPGEFQGTSLFLVATFSGAMAGIHFLFALSDRWSKLRKQG